MKNPFRGLRFSLLDFHAARASVGTKIAMLGIALIPLIYGALYLMAFYDPYGSLDTLSVAVVNEDVPVTTGDGKTVHAGDDLVEKLADSDSLDYHFVSDDEAQRGLESGEYYNKIVIPEDFSEKVASADSSDPQQARLVMVANEANNYLSSILGASVMRQVTANVNYAIGNNYYVEIFDKVEDTGSSIRVASDGAGELADGLADARDGADTIAEKLGEAREGSSTLTGGLTDAHDGSSTITAGLDDASAGADALAKGTVDAADGSSQITEGLADAKKGSRELAKGVTAAKSGSQTITDNLDTAATGAGDLDRGLSDLKDGLEKGKTGADQLASGTGKLKGGADQLAAGAAQLKGGIEAQQGQFAVLNVGVGTLVDKMVGMKDQLAALRGGLGQVSQDLGDIESQKDDLVDNAKGLITVGNDAKGRAAAVQQQVSALPDAVKGGMGSVQGSLEGAGDNLTKAGNGLADASQNLEVAGSDVAAAASKAGEACATLEDARKMVTSLDPKTVTQEDLNALAEAIANGQASAGASAQAAQDAGSDLTNAGTSLSQVGEGVQGAAGKLQDAGDGLKGLGTTLQGVSQLTESDDVKSLLGDLDTIQKAMPQVESGINDLLGKAGGVLGTAETTLESAQGMVPSEEEMTQLPALKAGTQQLVSSLTTTDDGTIYGGVCALAEGSSDLAEGAGTASEGATTLAAGMGELVSGAEKAQSGSSDLAEGLTELHKGSKTLTKGLGDAKKGSVALKKGLGSLYVGSETLTDGLGDAKTGSAALAAGLDRLHEGSATLTDGLASAHAGSATLTDGLGKLQVGAGTLADGLVDAHDGSRELADGLSDGVEKVADATEGADERAEMMSEPVRFEQEYYTSVANYGSGFAPYFIALGLWVGSLVMTFLLKPLNDRLCISGARPTVVAFDGLVPWLLVGLVQSLLLGATIQFACGIQVDHSLAYYGIIILSSAVFCAMIQAITAVFGFPGKFVAVVLLMLQLTTAAGTFPIETEFKIFQDLSPYLPMTYVVKALRQAMRGVDLALVGPSAATLLVFGLGSFAITCLVAYRKHELTLMDLHPLVDL